MEVKRGFDAEGFADHFTLRDGLVNVSEDPTHTGTGTHTLEKQAYRHAAWKMVWLRDVPCRDIGLELPIPSILISRSWSR